MSLSSRIAGYSLILLMAIVAITGTFMLSCGHAGASGDGTRFAYATDNANNTVSVIDMDTYEAVATIPGIYDPTGLALSPDNSRLYVTSGAGNSTTVIDTSTGQPIAAIPVGHMPTGVAVSPDGKTAYVTNVLGKSVSVIDTAENKVIATLNAGQRPSDVSINPRTGDVYVSNRGDGTVAVYRQNAQVKTIRIGTDAGASAVTPDGSRLYVVSPADHGVAIIDTATDRVIGNYTTDRYAYPDGIVLSPDGSYAYILMTNCMQGGQDGIEVVSTGNNKLLRTYPVDFSTEIAISPDGRDLFVSTLVNSSTIILRSTDGSEKAILNVKASKVVAPNAGINMSGQASTASPEPTNAPGLGLPPMPPGMPAVPPSAVGPAIAPPSAKGLPIMEIAIICAIIILVMAILVLAAVAGYVLLKK